MGKTEIEHINGAVVAMGKKANVSTPVNSMLTWLVKSIEEITCVSPKPLS